MKYQIAETEQILQKLKFNNKSGKRKIFYETLSFHKKQLP